MTTQDIKKAWKSTLVMGLGLMAVTFIILALTRSNTWMSEYDKSQLVIVLTALLVVGTFMAVVSGFAMMRSK